MEKTFENPSDSKDIKPVNPKGNQPWIFGKTDAEAEAPIMWPPDVKNWLTGKDLDAGKDWRQEKGMVEDEMVGWHHRLNAHELEQTLGDGGGQGNLVCCSTWGCKEFDTTLWLNHHHHSSGPRVPRIIRSWFLLDPQHCFLILLLNNSTFCHLSFILLPFILSSILWPLLSPLTPTFLTLK